MFLLGHLRSACFELLGPVAAFTYWQRVPLYHAIRGHRVLSCIPACRADLLLHRWLRNMLSDAQSILDEIDAT